MNTSILGITPSRFNQRQISSLRVRRPFCKHSLKLIGFQPLSACSPPLVVTLAGNCLERQAKRESDSPLPGKISASGGLMQYVAPPPGNATALSHGKVAQKTE